MFIEVCNGKTNALCQRKCSESKIQGENAMHNIINQMNTDEVDKLVRKSIAISTLILYATNKINIDNLWRISTVIHKI